MQQQQQHQHMGYSGGGRGGGGDGGGGLGLTRFRSAPATSLDILLQDNELTHSQFLSQLSANTSTSPPIIRNSANYSSSDAEPSFFGTRIGTGTGIATATGFGFFRQNSSPAELLAQLDSPSGFGCDGYFTNSGISANIRDSDKRGKELELKQEADFSSQLKEEYSVQLPSRMNSFSDMEMDKLFEDSVPCRIRAKRGCATHPRSIAERVRRTRISDRIRKLQELVPNMDKQTNTADMLEEAVEYVKLLQNQIQELSEHQKKCKCIARD